jgi:hypothetical protein
MMKLIAFMSSYTNQGTYWLQGNENSISLSRQASVNKTEQEKSRQRSYSVRTTKISPVKNCILKINHQGHAQERGHGKLGEVQATQKASKSPNRGRKQPKTNRRPTNPCGCPTITDRSPSTTKDPPKSTTPIAAADEALVATKSPYPIDPFSHTDTNGSTKNRHQGNEID